MSTKTVRFSRNTTNIFFHILTRCNLRCRHCYINPEQHGGNTLSLTRIKQWLDSFSDRMAEANIVFLGGEPTLHPDLAPAVDYARQLGANSVTVDTNGYLFNDILAKTSPDRLDYVSFSLDGANRRTNDAIRGEGSYEACLSGIKEAVSRGYHTSLIYTVSMANIDELAAMATIVPELGVDRFFIQVLGIRGKSARNQKHDSRQVPAERWKREIPAAAAAIAGHGVTVTFPKVFLEASETFECAGLVADNYFIFPNGRVYRCPLCEDFPLHSLEFRDNQLTPRPPLNESDLFRLTIPEGCVMNKLIQPDNLSYNEAGRPVNRVACCMLKEEVSR